MAGPARLIEAPGLPPQASLITTLTQAGVLPFLGCFPSLSSMYHGCLYLLISTSVLPSIASSLAGGKASEQPMLLEGKRGRRHVSVCSLLPGLCPCAGRSTLPLFLGRRLGEGALNVSLNRVRNRETRRGSEK